MPNDKLISIIIPIYNVETYLDKTISSVVEQTLKEIEIILVDDGSTDNSSWIADKWAEKDIRIRAIHKKNAGVTAARNDGLKLAQGKYIFFLDGDDYIEPDCLGVMHERAEDTQADWVVGDFVIECADGTSYDKVFPDFGVADNIQFLKYCYSNYDFYYTGRLIRRKFLVNASMSVPEDITYGEDNLAVTQLASQINLSVKVNVPTLHYVMRDASVTNRMSIHDMDMRSRALSRCYEFLKGLEYFEQIKQSSATYFVNQYMGFISRGYINPIIKELYKENKYHANGLSLKTRFFCFLSDINTSLSIGAYNMLRFLKRII